MHRYKFDAYGVSRASSEVMSLVDGVRRGTGTLGEIVLRRGEQGTIVSTDLDKSTHILRRFYRLEDKKFLGEVVPNVGTDFRLSDGTTGTIRLVHGDAPTPSNSTIIGDIIGTIIDFNPDGVSRFGGAVAVGAQGFSTGYGALRLTGAGLDVGWGALHLGYDGFNVGYGALNLGHDGLNVGFGLFEAGKSGVHVGWGAIDIGATGSTSLLYGAVVAEGSTVTIGGTIQVGRGGVSFAPDDVDVAARPLRGADGRFISSGDAPSLFNRSTQYPSGYRAGVVDEVLDANTIGSGPNAGMIRTADGDIVARNDPRLTIEHNQPVVDHWNDIGYDSSRAVRNDFYNDTSNMGVRLRSSNSADGGRMSASGVRYRQDVGSSYSQ